jgi:hypothetical protein
MALPKVDYGKEIVPQKEQGEVKEACGADRAEVRESLPVGPPGANVIDDETFRLATAKLVECMDAKRPVWDKDSKSFRMEPDFPTILGAVKLAFEYKIGRPIERQLVLQASAENWEAKSRRMMATPEGIRFMLAAGAITQEEAAEAFRRLKNATHE